MLNETPDIFEGQGLRTRIQDKDKNDLEFDYGQGPYLITKSDDKYLDMFSSYSVSYFGHNYPPILEAQINQLQKLTHLPSAFLSPLRRELASKLSDFSPFKSSEVYWAQTGSLANEYAIAVARKVSNRHNILSLDGSYHGLSQEISKLNGKGEVYKEYGLHQNIDPLIIPRCPINHPITSNTLSFDFEAFESLIKETKPAAIIIEAIQGSNGVIFHDKEILSKIVKTLRKYNVLIICDEIQTAFYRSKNQWGFEHYDFTPDIITIGKALGGGLPLAATLVKSDIKDSLKPGSISSTHMANNLNLASALSFISEVQKPSTLSSIERIESFFLDLKNELLNNPSIKEIRGAGAFWAIELVDNLATIVHEKLRNENILVGLMGKQKETLRIVPPIIVSDQELKNFSDILKRCLNS